MVSPEVGVAAEGAEGWLGRAGAAGVVVGGGAAGVCAWEGSSAAVTGRAACGVLSVPDRGPGDDCTRDGLLTVHTHHQLYCILLYFISFYYHIHHYL